MFTTLAFPKQRMLSFLDLRSLVMMNARIAINLVETTATEKIEGHMMTSAKSSAAEEEEVEEAVEVLQLVEHHLLQEVALLVMVTDQRLSLTRTTSQPFERKVLRTFQ